MLSIQAFNYGSKNYLQNRVTDIRRIIKQSETKNIYKKAKNRNTHSQKIGVPAGLKALQLCSIWKTSEKKLRELKLLGPAQMRSHWGEY